jgi:hypothetical protein
MITPVQKAPKAFVDRFNRIYDGEEVIDTVAKLKEFWLFALDQGQEHREMREYIAQLVFELNVTDKLNAFIYYDRALHNMIISWESFTLICESPNAEQTDEEFHDMLWLIKRQSVEEIDSDALDKKFRAFKYPAAK